MQRRKICRYFERGSCKKQNCPFVHLKENRKNCTFYMEGNCRKGNNCNFYHPPKQSEKLAELKQQLKAQKKNPLKKIQLSEDSQEIQEKPQVIKQQKIEEPQKLKLIQNQIAHQQKKQQIAQQQKQQQALVGDKNQSLDKINKINFLLGLNQQSDSQSEAQLEEESNQTKIIDQKDQIQFIKTFIKKFPDFSKTPQMKAKIAQNEKKFFNGQKYLNFITKIEDPIQKQYYQIIRKFTDHFLPSQNQIKQFSLRIRPLLFDKQISIHFQFVEDTLDLEVNMKEYPKQRATFKVTNKSVPQEYKQKICDILGRIHTKTSVFETLKYLQNHFDKIYGESKFRLENEHYSRKQLERKIKENKLAPKQQQRNEKQKRKKIRRDKSDQHPQVRVIRYKQGQKIDHLNFAYEITTQSIVLQNCQYVVVDKMLAYIECLCQKKIVYLFDASNDRALIVGVKLQCKKCQSIIIFGLQRQVVQPRRDVFGRVGVSNGHLLDLGGISFKIGCACNNQISKGKLYLPGQRITANCHNCFQSMLISYMGLKCYNSTLKAIQVRTDFELPAKGACKHMKLTFRWFRYGCCGRCFSCDDCHIMESAVLHEKIKGITMLCGYCSREQLVANDCNYCHKQLVKGADKSGHWEGGMGCRDQTLLSRKDAKKYTGMTKRDKQK